MFDEKVTKQDRIDAQSVLEQFPGLRSEVSEVFFGGDEQAVIWLTTPVPALNGLTPVEAVQEGNVERVLDTLKRLKYADFS